jgi:hypothetical protein
MNLAGLRIDLLESFDRLINELQSFNIAVLGDRHLPAWVSMDKESRDGLETRAKAVQLYSALWYQDDQDGRETLTCPGIVGASSKTLETAITCNEAKDAFKNAVLALKTLSKPEVHALMADLNHRHEEVARAMKRMGAARLNLKQAYRHIPFLQERPLKIGFTWSKQGRTIQRTTVAEARSLLERRVETPQIEMELQRLAGVPSSEILARARSVSPHLRANVVFGANHRGTKRRLMQAPLPIMVPLTPTESLPDFVPVDPKPMAGSRLQRSDVRIEEEMFLPSIRVYRYREPYR